ncbi:hypothetical protein MPTA5024_15930 [Microbispora sp. ATCC PTA-5024]|nr:hypothetical protein MPTA5024_15930 [Microbispora sp. ATCC PTA-5024]
MRQCEQAQQELTKAEESRLQELLAAFRETE